MHIYDALQDLIELTTPQCVIGINTACTYEDENGVPVEYACDVTLMWYDDQLQASEYVQRVHNGLVMAEYRLPLKQPLRVTV